MTDTNDDDAGGRPPRGRSQDRRAARDDRPARPPRSRDDGDRAPRKAAGPRARDGGGKPPGDRPFRKPAGDRPARGPRPEGGERPFRPRPDGGDRPFRARSETGDRPFRPRREDGDGPPRQRRPEGDRPPRRDGDRPVRPRREEGDRPPRREGGERPFRARRDEGERAFGDRPPRSPAGDRPPRGPRPEGDRPSRSSSDAPRRPRPEPKAPRRGYDEPPAPAPAEPVEERIAKIIARAGVASRRDAEKLIEAGRVTLAGEVVTSPALNVMSDAAIAVDGEPLPQRERTRLWLFHKPRGLVTTARDPEGRQTVFESLPPDLPRVVTVGRLDINTEGLLLLTNDGGLARVLAHPSTGWLRRYKVRAFGDVNQAALDALRDGVSIDGIDYGPIEARLDREQGDNVWITMGIREGKNREVKVILEYLGLQVNRLIRMSFGPFQLGDLEMGLVEEVPTRVLRDQLGEALAAEAGVDFVSPVREPVDDRAERRPERRERDERPARSAEDRPRRPREGERPQRRSFDDRPPRGGPREREERPAREAAPARAPSRTVWRADEAADESRAFKPRRKADPQAERAANAERPRQRVGSIQGKGGKVLVERLVATPKEEAPERPARRPRPPRDEAPRGDGPPRRPRARAEDGERPARSAGPRPPRADGPRPPRSDDRRPPRDARPPRDDGPPRRGPPSGARGGPPRGGPGGASRGGPKGPPRGGPKGPPRDRRS